MSRGKAISAVVSIFTARTLLLRARTFHRAHRGDQREVREALREVADLAVIARVPLFGEQPEVIAQREQPIEQLLRVFGATGERVVVGQPEAAREERTL